MFVVLEVPPFFSVIPAKAGIHFPFFSVIPEKAGIHFPSSPSFPRKRESIFVCASRTLALNGRKQTVASSLRQIDNDARN
jgi:hypothetical protein